MTINTHSIYELENSKHLLEPKDRSFAESLLQQFKKKGSLTVNQWPWVEKLVEKTKPETPKESIKVGEVSEIVKLFDNAKESKIQFPKLRYGDGEHELKLSLAGSGSRFPGSINLVVDGEWLGRISREGELDGKGVIPSYAMNMLAELCETPSEALEAYGRRVGQCALCGLTLTNHESIERGIGPICADKWGV